MINSDSLKLIETLKMENQVLYNDTYKFNKCVTDLVNLVISHQTKLSKEFVQEFLKIITECTKNLSTAKGE